MARDVKNIKAPARKGRGKMMYHPPPLIDNTKIVTSEKAEVFYLFLPQFSIEISLPTSLKPLNLQGTD